MTRPPREPNIESGVHHEPGGPVPPYEGRKTEGKSQEELAQEARERGHPGHDAGPREVSQAEREGLTATDPNPSGPMGVGESMSTSGNERMYGKSKEAQRADTTDAGVGGTPDNVDAESPTMVPGDQGG